MKCNSIMKCFMELDNYRSLPLQIRGHLIFCTRCRKDILSMRRALETILNKKPYDTSEDLSNNIMEQIATSQVIYKMDISSLKWISVGLIIFASIFLVSFSEPLNWLKGHFGWRLEVPLNIVLGLVISLYATLFIGTHIDEMKNILHFYRRTIRN